MTDRDPPAGRPRLLGWVAVTALLLGAVLVPFALFEDSANRVTGDILAWAGASRLTAPVLALVLAADVVLPIPSSLVGTAAGASLGMAAGAATSFAGMSAGCALGYALGRAVGRPGLRRFASDGDWRRVEGAAARLGPAALVVLRAVPVLAEASVLFAGAVALSRWKFALYTALANLGVSLVYAAVGAYAAGETSFVWIFLGAVAVPALTWPLVTCFARHV